MPNKIEMIGKTFNRLTVLEEIPERRNRTIYYKCQCECGKIVEVSGSALRSGHTKSCGCLRNDRVREKVGNKLEGQRFGRLVVLYQVDSIREPSGMLRTAWACQCDCGKIIIAKTINLKAGDTKSCGCLSRDNAKAKKHNLIGKKFGKLTVIKLDEERMSRRKKNDTHAYWYCQCDCGGTTSVNTYLLEKGQTTSCGCIRSQGEYLIRQILNELPSNYLVQSQYFFPDLRTDKNSGLYFDFVIFKDNEILCAIEYNGEQHYEPIEFFGGKESLIRQQYCDKLKREYCRNNNIPLIIIPFTDKNKVDLNYLKEKYYEAKQVCGHTET